MARRAEAVLCEKIMRKLRKIPDSFWERVEQQAVRGTADIVGCLGGVFYWIEVKTKFSEKLDKREKLQQYKAGQVLEAGGAVLLLDSGNWKFHCNRLKKKTQKDFPVRLMQS